ncbi:DoxX family membrane protein [Galbibacter mesophilus]|uniref:DoxX family membrane protein n=1 Tax=Galbibacter mesophilus TaxID=379069 RepID=UPI00191CDD49|nr:DoxX family membrane protein [Galbibacter mesophilus]MCM5663852.1 hypothetical protein [Galbibacter mesophilus]
MTSTKKISTPDKIQIGIAAVTMAYFGITKLTGQFIEIYEQFAEALPIDGATLMYMGGVAEVSVALFLLLGLLSNGKKVVFLALGFIMLLGTMFGALSIEFFIRSTPSWGLVSLAILLIFIAVNQLRKLKSLK